MADRVKKGKNKYTKIKDVRKTMYEIKDDPLLKKLDMIDAKLPSGLVVDDFAEARAHEVAHFTGKIYKSNE